MCLPEGMDELFEMVRFERTDQAYDIWLDEKKKLSDEDFRNPNIVARGYTEWKTQARMTPAAKFDLTPENNLFLTPEEFGRRGQFYFGLSAFEGFELTDAFAGERDTVCGVDDAVEDGIRHCGVADGVVPVQFGEL